jgi:hypothetical protein
MYEIEESIVTPDFISRPNVYNSTCGGNGGNNIQHLSAEAYSSYISKLSKPFTEERKHNISIASKTKIISEESKQKQKDSVAKSNKLRVGIPMSKESVEKSVASKKKNLEDRKLITVVMLAFCKCFTY